jgi:hypothetical protein
LAREARHELLVFIDADVRLEPSALPRLASWFRNQPRLHLASGVPRQVTVTFAERLLIPLIHFVLLSYLPLLAARLSRWTAFAAGCGQLFVARREAYFAAGGHAAIRSSLHDGVKLPRAFRSRGFRSDLFDATDVAVCRMYQDAGTVWRGLGKNATEGMANPAAIGPWTVLLGGGHILPWLLLPLAPWLGPDALAPIAAAAALSLLPRLIAAARFRQSWLGAFLHPLGVAGLLAIQWQALLRRLRGQPMEWRGRKYPQSPEMPNHPCPTP